MFSCCHFGKSRARICSSLTWSLSEKKTRASPIKLPCCTYYTDTELCCRRCCCRRLLGLLGAIQKNDRFFIFQPRQRDTYFLLIILVVCWESIFGSWSRWSYDRVCRVYKLYWEILLIFLCRDPLLLRAFELPLLRSLHRRPHRSFAENLCWRPHRSLDPL